MSDIKRTITPNEPADFTPTREPQIPLRPFRYWCQKVLPLVYDDSLSYYELLCKVVDYLNKTMEDISNMDTDITNLYNAYNELQSYVNNYFSTLDVQEEINNKLDDMVSSGKFDTILDNYFKKKANTYLTANDMIADNSLTVGNFCITQGFYNVNDGGQSMYLITDEPDTEILCVKLNNGLFARLWYDDYTVNIKALGANNETDLGELINSLLTVKALKWHKLYLPYGSYELKTTIVIDHVTNFEITGDEKSTTVKCNTNAIRLYGCDYGVIKNLIFKGNGENIGYHLSDRSFSTQDDRSGNTILERCIFTNFKTAIKIDAPSGYNYFNNITINYIPELAVAIEIGKDYANTSGIMPNYIYFNDCYIDAHATPNATCTGIYVHCGQFISFNNCDIANFSTSEAVVIDNDVNSIFDVSFINTQFFNNKTNANVKRSTTKVFTNIRFDGCNFTSFLNGSVGIMSEPTYIISSFVIAGCTFIGNETNWSYMLQFNNNVYLNVDCDTNVQNPYKHAILPALNNIKASNRWLFGKVSNNAEVPPDSSRVLTVGSNLGWCDVKNTTPITSVHNYHHTDTCIFGALSQNENTISITAYANSTNESSVIAYFFIV